MGSNPPKMQVEIRKRDNWFHLFEVTGYEFFPSKDNVRNLLRSGNFKESILPENSAEKGRSITLAEIKDIDWEERVEIQEHILEDDPEKAEKELREMFREKYSFYLIENEGETEVRPFYLLEQNSDKVIERSESNQNFDTNLMRKLSDIKLNPEKIQRLMKVGHIEEDGKTFRSERKARKDYRPERWNLLKSLMEQVKKNEDIPEEKVRLHAYLSALEG